METGSGVCSSSSSNRSSPSCSEYDLSHLSQCPDECACRLVLHGAKFVLSGFFSTDRHKMKHICRKIRLMGGKTLRRVDRNITHVLVGQIGFRAKQATEYRINCFRASYIDRCWTERHAKNFLAVEEGFVREYVVRVRKQTLSRGTSLRIPKPLSVVVTSPHIRRSTSRCSPRRTALPPSPPKPVVDEAALAAERKQFQQRKHLINELVETEKTYLVLLEFIAKNYVTPLQEQTTQRISPMKTDYAAAVFGPWKDLYSLHRSLLASLQESVDYSCAALAGSSIVPSIGGSFLTHINSFGRLYPDYITSFEHRNEFHLQALKSDAVFRAFIQTRRKLTTSLPVGSENSSLKKQSLRDMLIAPVQRLPRYLLLLQGILSATPESHSDKADISKAVTAIRETNEKINGMKMASEGEARLAELFKEIDGVPEMSDSSERRWVVSEADVVMIDDRFTPGSRTDLPVKLLVLSDSIQIALSTYTNRRQHLTHMLAVPYSAVLWFSRYLHGQGEPAGLPDIGVLVRDTYGKRNLFFSCEKSTTTSVTIVISSMMKAAQRHAMSTSSGTSVPPLTLMTQSTQTLPSWVRSEPVLPDECRQPVPALRNITNVRRNSDAFAPRVNPNRRSKTDAMLKLMTPDRRSKRCVTPTRTPNKYEPGSVSSSISNISISSGRSLLSSVGRGRRAKEYKPAPGPVPYQPIAKPQAQAQVQGQTQAQGQGQTQAQVHGQTQAQVHGQTQAQVQGQTQAQVQGQTQPAKASGSTGLGRRNSLLNAMQSGADKPSTLARKKSHISNRSSIFSRSSKPSSDRKVLTAAASSSSLPVDVSFSSNKSTSTSSLSSSTSADVRTGTATGAAVVRKKSLRVRLSHYSLRSTPSKVQLNHSVMVPKQARVPGSGLHSQSMLGTSNLLHALGKTEEPNFH